MKLEDVIAFAKAGYKPADVKALMELESKDVEVIEDEVEDVEVPEDEEVPEDDAPDISEEIKKLKEELEQTKMALKNAQKKNTKTKVDEGDGIDDVEVLDSFIRSFM